MSKLKHTITSYQKNSNTWEYKQNIYMKIKKWSKNKRKKLQVTILLLNS